MLLVVAQNCASYKIELGLPTKDQFSRPLIFEWTKLTIICLIGRHGSGKSTVGAFCAREGAKHISVGQLRRLANGRVFPSDIPVSLLLQFRNLKAGEPLSKEVSLRLLDYAGKFDHVVLDGFPAATEHLELLPASTIFCYLWVPAKLREVRLGIRSANTSRTWTSGGISVREQVLSNLINDIRKRTTLNFIRNTEDGNEAISSVGRSILSSFATSPC